MNDPALLRRLTFSAAAEHWLNSRKPYLRKRTFYGYGLHVAALNRFFGELVLSKIHIGHIREYQRMRTCNEGKLWTKPAGPSIVNHERHLRFDDVHLDHKTPWFRIDDATAKNEFRGRVVVMNATAQKQMRRCMERANRLGSGRPEHYIFPFREAPGRWNPARPTTDAWLRRGFAALREAAGLPWLTPHCLRHQHITLSYEAGEPEQQISQRVGHVHARMTRWYLGSRRESQQRAVDALDPAVRFGPKRAAPSELPMVPKNKFA